MKKSITALVASVACLFVVTGVASAQLPECPPGTSNPGYCETPTPEPEPGPPAARDDARSGARGAVKVLSKKGSLTRLCNGRAAVISATPDSPGVYTITLTIVVKGKTIVVARGTKTVSRAGRTRILLRPTKAGRKHLCGKNAVRGIVRSKFNPRTGRTITVRRVVRLRSRGAVRPRRIIEPNFTG